MIISRGDTPVWPLWPGPGPGTSVWVVTWPTQFLIFLYKSCAYNDQVHFILVLFLLWFNQNHSIVYLISFNFIAFLNMNATFGVYCFTFRTYSNLQAKGPSRGPEFKIYVGQRKRDITVNWEHCQHLIKFMVILGPSN